MRSKETIEKMRQAALTREERGTQASGWKLTEEQRRSHAMYGDDNPSKREDVKEKMRKAKLGKGFVSKEERRRRRIINKRAWDRVRKGEIEKKECERCGEINVEGHHEDYDKPYELMWLCKKCHMERHKELGSFDWSKKESILTLN